MAQSIKTFNRRLTQINADEEPIIHRRGAEIAENGYFVCGETTTNKLIPLLKAKPFAQSSSPDWVKILTSVYSASLR